MKIYTAHWKYSNDELYYSEHNRKMFTTREDADAFLTDLLNYEHIERYYVLEEAVIATFLITWCVLGLICWCVSELPFRDCLTHGATLMILMLIGWIPAIIVGNDVNDNI